MLDKAKNIKDTLVKLRRTIHQHPELGFEEYQTGALVANTLNDLGIEIQTGVGRTGVVARLGNGNGPRIGVRADMDALPILEANEVEYKSQAPGKMHACGHDAHTAMLLGAAMLLKDLEFDGEIRLIFQPSEERQDSDGVSGAMAMISDKAVEGLDAVIALHVDGTRERGQIAIGNGYVLANVATIAAKIIGKGGHGAMPHTTIDPIAIAGPVLTAIHAIVSRRIDPADPAVVTVGRIQGGAVSNVIPGEVELELTLRATSEAVRQELIAQVENALSIARALGGDYTMSVRLGYPALYNAPEVAERIRGAAKKLLGAENVKEPDLMMGAEDFAYMAQSSPGAMFFLGAKAPGGPPRFLHHPEFDIDEDALPIGAAILAQTALEFIKKKS
ncbi:MAG TPA: amidohydrolase [Anaerolineae bacterium]|nr:amidohydrolase [Anaerolineae bacterium]